MYTVYSIDDRVGRELGRRCGEYDNMHTVYSELPVYANTEVTWSLEQSILE